MFLEETNERTKKNIISFKIDNVYDVSIENKREQVEGDKMRMTRGGLKS